MRYFHTIRLEPIIRGLARPGYCIDRAIHLDTNFNITDNVFNSKSTLIQLFLPISGFYHPYFLGTKVGKRSGGWGVGGGGGVYRPRIVLCPHGGSAIVGGRPGQSS
jgi:hypothetical protein